MSLILITGPMYAGKTTRLFENFKKHSHGKRGILFKKDMDNRFLSNDVVAHNGFTISCTIIKNTEDILNYIEDYDVFAIDEGQFFEDIIKIVQILLDHNKIIIVAMLNGDFSGKLFTNSDQLFAICDELIFLKATCSRCGSENGTHSKLIKNIEPQGQLLVSAGEDTFVAVCRKCW